MAAPRGGTVAAPRGGTVAAPRGGVVNSPSSVVLVVALVFGLASWASARVARAEVTSRPPERVDAARDDEPPRVPGVAVLRGPSEQLRMKLAEARAELGCRLEALERLAGSGALPGDVIVRLRVRD